MSKEVYRSPRFSLEGYWARTVKYADGTSKTELEHRAVMEKQLARPLQRNEHVHHIDGDKKNNNPNNLAVLNPSEHAKEHTTGVTMVSAVCAWCSAKFSRAANMVKNNQGKQNKAGPFCGRSCAGKYGQAVQVGRIIK